MLSPRVLVVDDDERIRTLVKDLLTPHNITCHAVADGEIAARTLAAIQYDMVITDLRMPNCHGHALCRTILESAERPLVVVITGVMEPRLIRDLQARGVDDVFYKPLELPALVTRVHELLEARRKANSARVASPVPGPLASVLTNLEIPQETNSTRVRIDIAQSVPLESGPTLDEAVSTVAILMSDPASARRLAVQFNNHALRTLIPDTTDALCRFLENNRLDAIVIENSRFGFMTVYDILSHLQEVPERPRAVILDPAGTFNAERGGPLGISRVLTGAVSDSDMVRVVQRILAERKGKIISPKARALVRPFGLPTGSPDLLRKLTSYLRTPTVDVSVDDLSKEIKADPSATAELLRLANGAQVGLRCPVVEVADAVSRIGVSRTITLLLASGVKGLDKTLLVKLSRETREWYHLRTTLTASVTSVFAQRHLGLSGDTAFVLGLLQDLGIAVLANVHGERYRRLVERTRSVGVVKLSALEMEYFETNHAEVSAALLEHWQIPDRLIGPVRFHHDPSPNTIDAGETAPFIAAMRVGEAFVDYWDNQHPVRRQALLQQLADLRSGGFADYEQCFDESLLLAAEISQLFRVAIPDKQSVLAVIREAFASTSAAATP